MPKFKLTKRQKSMAIGLVCGLGCALCVGAYLIQVEQKSAEAQEQMLAEYGGDQIDVCVAKHDIVAGETITDGDIETRTWIATLLPSNVVKDKAEAVGKRVGSTILSGEPISSSRFGFDSDEIDIPEGMVAISVPARDVQAVGGAIKPGMVCDVYATGASSTSMIANSVQILATSMSQDGDDSSAWVTLAVDPGKVQEMVSSAQNLEIYLALPSSSGTNETSENGDAVEGGDQ